MHTVRKELHGTFAVQLIGFFLWLPGAFRVHSVSNPHPCTRIGPGLDTDWTRIGRGLDADWTRIGRGLDADCTRIDSGCIPGAFRVIPGALRVHSGCIPDAS